VVSLAGIGIALLGLGFGAFLLVRRLFVGPEVEGVFTLFAILFVFVGIQILALGLLGEYVGRIYLEVRRRPRYVVQAVYDHPDEAACRLPAWRSAPSGHE
jgi:undecaprenyl-phosphate 4-deoxy-4-formamido-L-arabinose transferase